ncbi:hypothetical protein LCGC14_2553600 [marine sediment metagenome]|uniref:Uncharacterized protein n=1 Tax=marine sediment metagenome TaxID=412755 RepID=A0A0F9AMQ6_9ZZZZ
MNQRDSIDELAGELAPGRMKKVEEKTWGDKPRGRPLKNGKKVEKEGIGRNGIGQKIEAVGKAWEDWKAKKMRGEIVEMDQEFLLAEELVEYRKGGKGWGRV